MIIASSSIIGGIEPTYVKIYDGNWITDCDSYLTIHRIATKKGFSCKGASSMLIDYANKLCLERNIKSVRIDTHKDNLIMQKFILKHHFTKCGIVIIQDGDTRVAYEKIIV